MPLVGSDLELVVPLLLPHHGFGERANHGELIPGIGVLSVKVVGQRHGRIAVGVGGGVAVVDVLGLRSRNCQPGLGPCLRDQSGSSTAKILVPDTDSDPVITTLPAKKPAGPFAGFARAYTPVPFVLEK